MTIRALIACVMLVALAACHDWPPEVAPPVTDFMATLSGDDVVPPVTATASGTIEVHIRPGIGPFPRDPFVAFRLTVTGLGVADSVRIYYGNPGANGPALADLCAPCTAANGVLATGRATLVSPDVSFEDFVHRMRGFGTYVGIRAGGAPVLRGQLRVVVD